MMLTVEQKATLKTAIVADNALNALYADGNLSGLAAAINAVAQPAFIVWKTSVSVDEIMRNGMDWARVDNLTVGKARIWDWLGRLGSFDASKPNVRVGIDSAWVGTAADLAVRAAVYTHCKRSATFVEKLLATGTGSDANPATMSYEGEVSWSELVGL
jgi:hypothetical protein